MLASVLTPERVARLHAAGFSDPGRAPNYRRIYRLDEFDDAAIARELPTILYDAYGYKSLARNELSDFSRLLYPSCVKRHGGHKMFVADGGYAGEKLVTALAGFGSWTIDIVKRADRAKGFQLLPRRWAVERTFAWFGRNRRRANDFEATIASSQAWLYLALSWNRITKSAPSPHDRCS